MRSEMGRVLPDAHDMAYKTGWDVVFDVMTRHVPVLIGVAAFFIVLMSPYVYTLYVRYVRKPGQEPAAPEEYEPHPWFSKRENEDREELAADMETIKPLRETAANAASGSRRSDDEMGRLESAAGKLATVKAKTMAMRLLGDIHRAAGNNEKARDFYLEALKGGAKAKKDVALGACGLSAVHEAMGETEQALNYARRALVLLEQAGMHDETDGVTERIKKLKSGK